MFWAESNIHWDIGDEKRYVLEVWLLAQVAFKRKIAQSNFRREAGDIHERDSNSCSFPLQDSGDPGLASSYLPLLKPIQH
jgi:hypothetical protein